MRDNLFRAKVKYPKSSTAFIGCDKNEGEWAVGDLHVRAAIPHIHNLWKRYPIDKDTVGQFTGLYDKDGKEIYEGDIIEYTHEVCLEDGPGTFNGVVCFRCGVFCIEEDEGSPLWQLECESEDYGGICVIGNIHDNPELLKGGNK